jgi:hypothetical protein
MSESRDVWRFSAMRDRISAQLGAYIVNPRGLSSYVTDEGFAD